jgi:O-antigen/teichoic acid export membrane protein
VASFGVWRAATQTIRPGLLTLLRLLVVGAAGAATYGPIEAARVYTAPSLVLVTGLGSFLLPYFVALRTQGPAVGLRTADRAAATLAFAVAGIGLATTLVLPWLGPLLTGGGYDVPVPAVAGWATYAAASALLLPYSVLASVRGGQRRVLGLRALELCSLALVLVLVTPGGDAALWTPMALALGPTLTAVAVRRRVLVPMVRAETGARVGQVSARLDSARAPAVAAVGGRGREAL